MAAGASRNTNFRPSGDGSTSAITMPTMRCSAASRAGGTRCHWPKAYIARSPISAAISSTMSDQPIPQADPRAGYRAQQPAIDAAIARVLEGGRYVLGPELHAFEREFAAYIGCRHGIGA